MSPAQFVIADIVYYILDLFVGSLLVVVKKNMFSVVCWQFASCQKECVFRFLIASQV